MELIDKSRFRNSQGRVYTQGLFIETAPDPITAVYTLADEDKPGYPSLYKLYISEMDPAEYTFATRHLYSYSHWEALCKPSFFKPIVARWRKELALKIKSEALARAIVEGQSGGKTAFAINKWLTEGGYDKAAPAGKGRPSKEEVTRKAKELAEHSLQVEEDYDRLLSQTQGTS